MFKTDFGKHVVNGDYIVCDVDGFRAFATLYVDDDNTPPDKRQDGFWPSLDPNSDGYIGPKSKRTLARHQAHAEKVMSAWHNDEWHYFGVAVTVWKGNIQLTGDYDHALWGIEGNWPGFNPKKNTNEYFRKVANDYLPEALAAAKAKINELVN